ncbi:hypothetical protein SLEP1_g33422 [Rubroshorea leprosula]|uniref:TF-B3 domain-containing protein n=1 Tax=Rubroshorea leprosula TaxID=152421 RepID=A0AAV5KGQ3_9ROSI|nr:hypothetical protein SLEP1_g33422 [Rubroshorea leprosula]
MVAIFEHRNIEQNDLGTQLKFPGNANLPSCWNLSSGKSLNLDVKDDQKKIHKLTVQERNGYICFSGDGWKNFKTEKRIEKDDKISFYNSGVEYSIKVEKA